MKMESFREALFCMLKEVTFLSDVHEDWGYSKQELVQNEKRLGFRLPDAMRQLYLIAGHLGRVMDGFHHFVLLNELAVEDGILRFCYERNRGTCWGIPVRGIEQSDPLVITGFVEAGTWSEEKESLSDFLFRMICYHIYKPAPGPSHGRRLSRLLCSGTINEEQAGRLTVDELQFRQNMFLIDCMDVVEYSPQSSLAIVEKVASELSTWPNVRQRDVFWELVKNKAALSLKKGSPEE